MEEPKAQHVKMENYTREDKNDCEKAKYGEFLNLGRGVYEFGKTINS